MPQARNRVYIALVHRASYGLFERLADEKIRAIFDLTLRIKVAPAEFAKFLMDDDHPPIQEALEKIASKVPDKSSR